MNKVNIKYSPVSLRLHDMHRLIMLMRVDVT